MLWLRQKAGVKPGEETGIDLSKLRLKAQVELDQLRAQVMHYEEEVGARYVGGVDYHICLDVSNDELIRRGKRARPSQSRRSAAAPPPPPPSKVKAVK